MLNEHLLKTLNVKLKLMQDFDDTHPMHEARRKECNELIQRCYETGYSTEELIESMVAYNPDVKYKLKVIVL